MINTHNAFRDAVVVVVRVEFFLVADAVAVVVGVEVVVAAVAVGVHRAQVVALVRGVAAVHAAFAVVGVASVTTWWVLVGLVFVARCVVPVRTVLGGANGPALIPVLAATGAAELIWAVGVAVPLLLA